MEDKIIKLLRKNRIGKEKAMYLAHELLFLFSVNGSFTAADMEEAYNDGAGINKPREFNIENYR